MALVPSIIHAIGDVAAPVLEAGGAINSALGGGGELSQVGHAISNQNQTYTGSLNPITALNNTGGTSSFVGSPTSTLGRTTSSGNSGSAQNVLNSANTPLATGSTLTPAQQQAQDTYNNLLGSYNSSIQSAIGTNTGDYAQGIQDLVTPNINSQNTINSQAVQNELAKLQGLQGVTSMVGNGIQGGGVQIADAGGGTSSAGAQLAQDYGIVGRQAASQVGNQYAQGQNTINNSQAALNNTEQQQIADMTNHKSDLVNSIVQSAQQQLSYLSAIGASTGNVADQVNIAQQIAQVKAQATAALTAYDSQLGGINTTQQDQPTSQAQAQTLFAAGTVPANAFNFTTQAPAQVANTGPSPSSLPIFIAPASKNNDQT